MTQRIRHFLRCLFGSLLALCAASASFAQSPQRTPVLVELFTSEGCSSCPPADALLRQLDKEQHLGGADIIVLEEHVDYWESLGWHDRFSSRQYTQRQSGYSETFHLDSIYTPQMVVDGQAQFVGNDEGKARRTIVASAREMKVPLTLTSAGISGKTVSGTIASGSWSSAPTAELYAALVDPRDSTDVRAGENSGSHLEHAGVVRVMRRIGSMGDLGHGAITFQMDAPMMAEGMRLVVFAQQPRFGKVVGAAVIDVRGATKVARR